MTEGLFNVTLNPSIHIFRVTVADLNELQSFLIVALLACDHQKSIVQHEIKQCCYLFIGARDILHASALYYVHLLQHLCYD